jgi:hypothetical protein
MTCDPFVRIESAALEQVSGAGQRIASGAGGSDINQQLMLQLQQIGSSIKDLAGKQQQPDMMSQMLPMLMMMKQQ